MLIAQSISPEMEAADRQHLLKLYSDAFQVHGVSPQGLLWSNTERVKQRFADLARIGPLEDKSILDIGCGFGFLYDYLKAQGWNGEYAGIDFNQELIEAAKTHLPAASFAYHDITQRPWQELSEYAFISGMFNTAVSEPWTFLTEAVTNAFASTTKGLAFNFLTDQVDTRYEEGAYFNPAQVLDFCLHQLSPYVQMETQRMDFNVVVYVYHSLKERTGPR